MKRRIISILLVSVMILSVIAMPSIIADSMISGNYVYEMYTEETVIITNYKGLPPESLTIPSELDGYKVVAIGDYAFAHLEAEEVTLPDTVEYIGTLAFLNTVVSEIHIPESVISLGVASFCGEDFVKFTVDEDNEAMKAVDGVLYSKDGTVLISYPCGKSNAQYRVLDGVEYIYNGAFFSSYNLEEVILPEGLLGIYPEAFVSCIGIETMDIPASVEYLGEYAFAQCSSLKEINVLGGDIYNIATNAFEGTYWYENRPWGVTYLGTMVYGYISSAESDVADIKEGTTMICGNAFSGRSPNHPSQINIPATVEIIDINGMYAKHLKAINIHEDNKYFCSVEGVMYSKDMTVLYTCPSGYKTDVLVIPDGVEVIYDNAFKNCCLIKSIVLPDSLLAIGDSAFHYCNELRKIEFPDSLQYVGQDIMSDCFYLEDIIIPEGTVLFSYKQFENTYWYNRAYEEFLYLNGCVLGYAGEYKFTTLGFPKDTLSVGIGAFAGYSNIRRLVLPDTLRKIGACAFENCTNLKEVVVPASVDEICPYALGYTFVEGESEYEGEHFPIEGFVIKGYTNSVAEVYALENGFDFVSVGVLEVSKLLGDADLSGELNVRDVTAIQKYLSDLLLFTEQQKINSDFNGDGVINVRDATAIQKALAGLA